MRMAQLGKFQILLILNLSNKITNIFRMLQTVQGAKRKGYAALVVKAFSKKLAEEGLDTIGYIVIENEASKKLFKSIGFDFIGKNCFLKTMSF